jgi:hypothetical protein
MPVSSPVLSQTRVDELLEQIAEALQLTPTQYGSAAEKYGAVGRWLGAPESQLYSLQPVIYPQGSKALQTTVKPLRRMEYDLDLVCEVRPSGHSAMQLFDLVYTRLHENGTYRPILEKKKRCVRLNYAGNFHLDIIPARPDASRPSPSVLIPDRKLEAWTRSNPKGYAAWFHTRGGHIEKLRAAVEPLPNQTPPDLKTPLSVAVQIIKRRRDVMFGDSDLAPRSVVLTTLAAKHYTGEQHVAAVVAEVLAGIDAEIRAAAPQRICVPNPTNPDERFCDSFTAESYEAFADFVRTMLCEVGELNAAVQRDDLRRRLVAMFGEGPVQDVLPANPSGSADTSRVPAVHIARVGERVLSPAEQAKLAALNSIAANLSVTPQPYNRGE